MASKSPASQGRKNQWMLYGANGYTGTLIAELASKQGERPIIAGRNSTRVKELAAQYNCEARIFDLDQPDQLATALQGVTAVLNCAGPFVRTVEPMLKACLASRCHYLDITGEIEVFEWLHAQDPVLKKAGIVALPGVGFDVVPSDCLAAQLKKQLPDAETLNLAFYTAGGKLSPGTSKTMAGKLDDGGKIRKDGTIVSVPIAYDTREIDFGPVKRLAVTIPWGDVSTAFYSTGIPNIAVYLATKPEQIKVMQKLDKLRWLFKSELSRRLIQQLIGILVKGPSDEERANSKVHLWGEAMNKQGQRVTASLTTPDGYSLTAATAMAAVQRVVHGDVKPGFQTPSLAFGAEFIQSFL